jgi:D-alanyl-D-alanine carboxypeptidase
VKSIVAILLAALSAAAAQATCLGTADLKHPATVAMPDSFWQTAPEWRDLTLAEQDFLARVAIATRNKRTAQPGRMFQLQAPDGLAGIPGTRNAQFVADGVPALLRMLDDARKHLANSDPGGAVELGTAYRSFDEQLHKWPGHVKRYFLRQRGELAAHLVDGVYGDAAVCAFRDLAGKLYGFPGYSNHQSGRAIDFRTQVGAKGPLMTANTDPAAKAAWCATPFFKWMQTHAHTYGFVQEDIDEPWHWVFDPDAAKIPARAEFIPASCGAPSQ